MMVSIKCSGKVLQALSESGSGQASWPSSAALLRNGIRHLVAQVKSWHPCCTTGLTVFRGRHKPKSPERLRPTSAECSDCVVSPGSISVCGVLDESTEASQVAWKCHVAAGLPVCVNGSAKGSLLGRAASDEILMNWVGEQDGKQPFCASAKRAPVHRGAWACRELRSYS